MTREEGAMRRDDALRDRFDLFPKISDDFARRTATGGAIATIGLALMVILFLQQTAELMRTTTAYDLRVDDGVAGATKKIVINVDLTLRAMHCAQVSLDAMDVTGETRLDVSRNEVRTTRVDARGRAIAMTSERTAVNAKTEAGEREREATGGRSACGDCYGAAEAGTCCDDCDSVREAYRVKGWALPDLRRVTQCAKEYDVVAMRNEHKEGCHFSGHFEVNKVAGNFHIAPGKSYNNLGQHVHDLSPFAGVESFNFSHVIHKLSFGEEFPGVVNPLDGVTRTMDDANAGVYQYRLSVVPARYKYLGFRARVVESNDYSVTDHFRGFDVTKNPGLPGLFFFYDLSPLRVEYEERRIGFFQYLSNVAAIIGGVSAVVNIVDGLVYRGQRALREKVDLGKQG